MKKMPRVPVTEFRQNLPAWLGRVRKGERLAITSRGKVIAELSPPAVAPQSASEAARTFLRGSVLRYDRPFDPAVEPQEWDINR
ncbi:MAG: type II toxin-antitoxin system Phd/YefM family antitoxin [Chromatiales bacterium]|nr:type II toxin-antitoxin system Phd/YefM family antitoxin [Chromatiales bacterium]